MMDLQQQLQLQAFVDGELSPTELQQVEARLSGDAQARALVAELRATNEALKGFEEAIKLPESREFYWSKIERSITAAERRAAEPARPSLLAVWRRMLVPLGATAAMVIALFFAFGPPHRSMNPELEASLADPAAFTYRDFANGTTLVWFSYPAENEFE
jgi:anti-sigma factor RsiW